MLPKRPTNFSKSKLIHRIHSKKCLALIFGNFFRNFVNLFQQKCLALISFAKENLEGKINVPLQNFEGQSCHVTHPTLVQFLKHVIVQEDTGWAALIIQTRCLKHPFCDSAYS